MKVKTIVGILPKAFKDMDKTTFTAETGETAYTFAKIVEGGEYDGEFTTDKAGNVQFKKTKDWPKSDFQAKPKEFKADPVKNASIEKQVCLKASVELLAAKLPLMKTQPSSAELAKAALIIAKEFDTWFKDGGTPSPKVNKEGVNEGETKSQVKAVFNEVEEVPFTDDDIPGDIDLDSVEF